MDTKVLGIDLGKTVCSLAGLDVKGAVVFRARNSMHNFLLARLRSTSLLLAITALDYELRLIMLR
ncbi:hypothetical protein [uncultured Tateyamaria sp.]|uniref:hypothetical protein n=1 Tax=uncultured Tateyamaria sp. TaxID=455651 RepID=UPI002610DD99|nr:hypothetical protein [uncultured Tateyamaria sp.]